MLGRTEAEPACVESSIEQELEEYVVLVDAGREAHRARGEGAQGRRWLELARPSADAEFFVLGAGQRMNDHRAPGSQVANLRRGIGDERDEPPLHGLRHEGMQPGTTIRRDGREKRHLVALEKALARGCEVRSDPREVPPGNHGIARAVRCFDMDTDQSASHTP